MAHGYFGVGRVVAYVVMAYVVMAYVVMAHGYFGVGRAGTCGSRKEGGTKLNSEGPHSLRNRM